MASVRLTAGSGVEGAVLFSRATTELDSSTNDDAGFKPLAFSYAHMAFPPDESKLVSIFIQTLLYGAYTVVFILTCWVLTARRPKREPLNKKMLFISILMFVLATMHLGVNYTRIIKAFIVFRDVPGGPAAFFNQLAEFTQLFGTAIYVTQTLVGDSVVLYRCYMVWGRELPIVAFPLLLLLGSTATGIGIIYSMARVVPEAEIFVEQLQDWIVSFFSLTLATNIVCTGLVAFRIWSINRQVMRFVDHSFRPIILLVVESGAVYSVTLLALLILYKAESWFQYVLLDAISPIVGLVFSMIIVRIGLGITSLSGQTKDLYISSSGAGDSPSHPHRRGRWADSEDGAGGKGAVFSRIRFGPIRVPGELTTSTTMSGTGTGMETETTGGAGARDIEMDFASGRHSVDDKGEERKEEGGVAGKKSPVVPLTLPIDHESTKSASPKPAV